LVAGASSPEGANIQVTPPLVKAIEYRTSQLKAEKMIGSCSLPNLDGKKTTFSPGVHVFLISSVSQDEATQSLLCLMDSSLDLSVVGAPSLHPESKNAADVKMDALNIPNLENMNYSF